MAADSRIDKWTRWVQGPVKNTVLTLHHRRQIWRELARVIKEHGALPDSSFWQYHLDLYATTQAVAIRRQADTGRDVASMAKLLTELAGDAGRITPEFWVGLWSDPSDAMFARRQWDENFAGTVGTHLDPAIPKADLEKLRAQSAAVKTFVDKHIAHADQRPAAAKAVVTLIEIDAAIDTLGELFQRYASLFTASDWPFLEPVIQHDWLAPFRIPWIKPRQPPRA